MSLYICLPLVRVLLKVQFQFKFSISNIFVYLLKYLLVSLVRIVCTYSFVELIKASKAVYKILYGIV